MNYYNDIDRHAAQAMRELIADGMVPPGDVDERSIADVQAEDLKQYSQCHFFAGGGGWPIALRLAGWPDNRPVWTGSCPCQPFSSAGKRKGEKDTRNLWPEFFRLIKECRPAIIFGEQVASNLVLGSYDENVQHLRKEQARDIVQKILWCKRRRTQTVVQRVPAGIREEVACPLEGEVAQGQVDSFAKSQGILAAVQSGAESGLFGGRDTPSLFPAGLGIRLASSRRCDTGEDCQACLRSHGISARHNPINDVSPESSQRTIDRPDRPQAGVHHRQHQDRLCGGEFRNEQLGGGRIPSDRAGMGEESTGIDDQFRVAGQAQCESTGDDRSVWLDRIFNDMESIFYACAAADLCAAGIGAPHIRQRLYWLADAGSERRQGRGQAGPTARPVVRNDGPWSDYRIVACRDGKTRRIPAGAEPVFLRLDDGLPAGVGEAGPESGWPVCWPIKGRAAALWLIGNAIVPQLAAEFVKAYMA